MRLTAQCSTVTVAVIVHKQNASDIQRELKNVFLKSCTSVGNNMSSAFWLSRAHKCNNLIIYSQINNLIDCLK